MNGCMRVTSTEPQALWEQYRKGSDPHGRVRAHLIVLLAQGYSWAVIAGVLFGSTRTIARWKTRVGQEGVTAVLGAQRTPQPRLGSWWSAVVAGGVTELTPRHCGFLRSRWCWGVSVLRLREVDPLQVSPATVRRWLQRAHLVWRRPRPVVGPPDPQRAATLPALRQLLATLPANEIAVFQDEVDSHPNPKLGALGRRCGPQAKILTPGTNENRYLAGSLNWRTGALLVTEGCPQQGRNAALFVRHLDDLRCHLLCYRKSHVICDNARFHDCRLVQPYLHLWGHRLVLHFVPQYAPDTTPIERSWWHLHEEITRNHRCQTRDDLLDLVFAWLQTRGPFVVAGEVYLQPQAA